MSLPPSNSTQIQGKYPLLSQIKDMPNSQGRIWCMKWAPIVLGVSNKYKSVITKNGAMNKWKIKLPVKSYLLGAGEMAQPLRILESGFQNA